jgi:hypothetical protein
VPGARTGHCGDGWCDLPTEGLIRLWRRWPISSGDYARQPTNHVGPPLDFQAKSTVNWELADDKIVYDLEAKTFNDIVSRTSSETTLILILLCLPKDQSGWHAASSSETILRHCCY